MVKEYTKKELKDLASHGVLFVHSKKLSSSSLLSYLSRDGYNTGTYGCNFDIFFMSPYIAIITGDRPSNYQRNTTEQEERLIANYSEKLENAKCWSAKKVLLENFKSKFIALNY